MKTKELTIEEKAKAYDSMFERLKEMYNNNKTNVAARLKYERYFPELKEVEEERIRKTILSHFKSLKQWVCGNGVSKEDCIAWLEKQGEQKPAEWSKEDERNFDIIYGIIYNSCIAEDASRLNAWLLSLRPKKQWKPSKEQIMALRWVLNNVPYNGYKEEISGLLEQIKDL